MVFQLGDMNEQQHFHAERGQAPGGPRSSDADCDGSGPPWPSSRGFELRLADGAQRVLFRVRAGADEMQAFIPASRSRTRKKPASHR